MQIIIKNVNLINPQQKLNKKTDLLVENGIIIKIEDINISGYPDAEVYDFNGKYCAPGFYDMHVHLREPGREDKETVISGCNAAAAGGFTGVAAMPNTTPAADSAETIRFVKEKAHNHLVDVDPVGAVTIERKGESLAPMLELSEAGAVAFSDDGTAVKSAGILRKAMEYTKMINGVILEHCEEESLAGGAMNESEVSTHLGLPSIPTIAEDLIVSRDIIMAEYLDAKVHIAHISSKNAVDMVRQAKKKGIKVTAEVAPHHFSLTDEAVKGYDTNYKMNPPLRQQKDVDAMIEGLKDGTIDCIASDHAPHTIEEKEVEFIYAPNGIIGLETQLGLVLTELYHKKHLSLEQIVEKLSINPRKVLGLKVPEIKEGEIANLSIFDADAEWTVDIKKFRSRSINSPYGGKKLKGKPVAVINKAKMFTNGEMKSI